MKKSKKQTDMQMIRGIEKAVLRGKERMIKIIAAKLKKMTPAEVQMWYTVIKS